MHMIASNFQMVTFDSIPDTKPLDENNKAFFNDLIVIYYKHEQVHY